jgi:hypothetical protein
MQKDAGVVVWVQQTVDDGSRDEKQLADLLDGFTESAPFAGPVVELGGDPV